MLDIKKLQKTFSSGDTKLVVLNDLSFSIKDKEFVSIIGRSGSGKSTLLYQLSLLDRPTTGEIFLDGVNMNELTDDQRTEIRLKKLGYIFQDYALVPTLTALENVLVPLLMQQRAKSEALQLAKEALDTVELGDKLDNLPSQLSGGQQQRVSIARAIAHQPQVIFADEPTANLDSESSEVILELFLKLNKKGQTIVMVTHEMEYAQRTGRILTLGEGVIIKEVINKKK